MRKPRPPKRSTIISTAVVIVLALAGSTAYILIKLEVFAPSLSEQVSKVERADGSWWLGRTFEGLAITHASPAKGDRVDDLGYGVCQRFGGKLDPFASTRCGYPLWLQVRKRRYALSFDEIPHLLDGTCARTTIRGAPVVVGPSGAVLYTGDLAIAVLGRADQVGRALTRLRSPRGAARFEPPTLGVEALSNCRRARNPFPSLASRIDALRRSPGLPLVWMGQWYAGGRLSGADRSGDTVVLSYTSCGRGSDLGSCLETISLSSEPANPQSVKATLTGATCRTFTAAGAPGVAWKKDLAGESGAGVLLFTDRTTISFANDITLESIPLSRVEAVSRLVRPLPPARRLTAPTYDTRPLLRACADLQPVDAR